MEKLKMKVTKALADKVNHLSQDLKLHIGVSQYQATEKNVHPFMSEEDAKELHDILDRLERMEIRLKSQL